MTTLKLRLGALVAVTAVGLSACGGQPAASTESASGATTITVEDNFGQQTVTRPASSVVATDNRTFETLSAFGVKLSAAAVALMPSTLDYTKDTSIVDLGNHREPKLEAVVAAAPDLIINGQRFAQYRDDFSKLVPDATIIELDPRADQPLDAELKRQTTVLGEVFGKQAEAKKLTDDFDAAIARAKAAYKKDQKVMGLIVSGGNINYSAPTFGRTIGPVFDILGLTPALTVEGASEDHQGDDISVEAIAASNPSWILAMDRDAAISAKDASYKPANEILDSSEALKNVTATRDGNIIYMPADSYTNEGIQTYTEFFNAIADAFEGK